ncbi:MAG: hypothetical protein M0R06_06500 [Sphaerochaeta sp.]|jgi:hypothetical protein|nr:hypothetical protein [Sphaerochaeta sp.]MDD4985137.1 hypothetical protein [Dehalococcoidales bacterium]
MTEPTLGRMAGVQLWGWDSAAGDWVPILVNSEGKLIIDPSEILEDSPTDNEVGKAPTSNWAHDHAANASAHHARYSDAEAVAAAKTVKLDDFTAPDDSTDLDVSVTRHGLCPKLPNDSSKYLNGVGSWSAGSSLSAVFDSAYGDTVRHSNDPEVYVTGTAYVKAKQITITSGLYWVRLGWQGRVNGGTGYLAVYKNGIAIPGDSITYDNTTYASKILDCTAHFGAGDTLEIWLKNSSSSLRTYVKELDLCYDNGLMTLGGFNTLTSLPFDGDPPAKNFTNDL